MAPTNTADVAKGLQGLWAILGLSTQIPGGMWFGRVGDSAASPYATLKVTEGGPEYNATLDFIQPFTLQITVWSDTGGADAGLLQQALDTAIVNENAGLINLRNGRVMQIYRAPGEIEDDPARRKASDVKMAAATWEMMTQTRRV